VKNNGYVGIGTGTPSSRLHINQSGSGWADGLRLQLQSNVWDIVSDDNGNRLVFNKNQNATYGFSMWGTKFGIGTLNPAARLYINQLGGNWEDGIRLSLDAHSWDVVSDANGERLLITRDQNTSNGISIFNGQVGIGTANPDAKLAVKGQIHTQEVRVDMNGWADHVFEKNYHLRPLAELENFINQNKHLPEIPTTKEVEANGVLLGEMNMLLLKKVEELTLYMIEMKKENVEQRRQIENQQMEIDVLKSKIK
jgi:hypothetical protein